MARDQCIFPGYCCCNCPPGSFFYGWVQPFYPFRPVARIGELVHFLPGFSKFLGERLPSAPSTSEMYLGKSQRRTLFWKLCKLWNIFLWKVCLIASCKISLWAELEVCKLSSVPIILCGGAHKSFEVLLSWTVCSKHGTKTCLLFQLLGLLCACLPFCWVLTKSKNKMRWCGCVLRSLSIVPLAFSSLAYLLLGGIISAMYIFLAVSLFIKLVCYPSCQRSLEAA